MTSIEDELWDLCKQITRLLYKDCYTCNQVNLQGKNAHTGHMYPKGALGASLKYDLRILRLQCFHCNINLGGMGAVYKSRMESEIGRKNTEKLYAECVSSKGNPIEARPHYLRLIEEYKKLLNDIVV